MSETMTGPSLEGALYRIAQGVVDPAGAARLALESHGCPTPAPDAAPDALRDFCMSLLRQYDRLVKSGQDNLGAALCIVQAWEADKLRAALAPASAPAPDTALRELVQRAIDELDHGEYRSVKVTLGALLGLAASAPGTGEPS